MPRAGVGEPLSRLAPGIRRRGGRPSMVQVTASLDACIAKFWEKVGRAHGDGSHHGRMPRAGVGEPLFRLAPRIRQRGGRFSMVQVTASLDPSTT
eukprot:5413985-Prymnesium_polylepis.1